MGAPSFPSSVLSNVFPRASLPVQNLVIRQVPTFTQGGQVQQTTQVSYNIGDHSFIDTHPPGTFTPAAAISAIQTNQANVAAIMQGVTPGARRIPAISTSGADIGYFPDDATAIAFAQQQLGPTYTYVPFDPNRPPGVHQFTVHNEGPALTGQNHYSLTWVHLNTEPDVSLFAAPSFLGGTGVTAGATVIAPGGPGQPAVPVPGPFAPTPSPPPAQPASALPGAPAVPPAAPGQVVISPAATSVVQTGFDASSVQNFLQANGYGVLRVIDLGRADDPAVAASLGVDPAPLGDPRHWFEAFFE